MTSLPLDILIEISHHIASFGDFRRYIQTLKELYHNPNLDFSNLTQVALDLKLLADEQSDIHFILPDLLEIILPSHILDMPISLSKRFHNELLIDALIRYTLNFMLLGKDFKYGCIHGRVAFDYIIGSLIYSFQGIVGSKLFPPNVDTRYYLERSPNTLDDPSIPRDPHADVYISNLSSQIIRWSAKILTFLSL